MSEDEKQKPTPEPALKPFKIEFLDKMTTLVAAAFGFVAAFAWNETFKAIIHNIVADDEAIIILLGYSVIITIVAVLIIISIARATSKAKAVLEHK